MLLIVMLYTDINMSGVYERRVTEAYVMPGDVMRWVSWQCNIWNKKLSWCWQTRARWTVVCDVRERWRERIRCSDACRFNGIAKLDYRLAWISTLWVVTQLACRTLTPRTTSTTRHTVPRWAFSFTSSGLKSSWLVQHWVCRLQFHDLESWHEIQYTITTEHFW